MKKNKLHFLRLMSAFALVAFVVMMAVNTTNAKASESDKAPAASKSKEGDFIKGAMVWANNCTRCHNMRDPKEFNDREWKVIMSHMRVRAGLTGQESRDVLKFLQQSN